MNNNFANWDLTQLLPEQNPYKQKELPNYWWGMYKKSLFDGFIKSPENYEDYFDFRLQAYEGDFGKIKETKHQGRKLLRDAWTYEDIRLYLESKGYIITVYPYVDDVTVDEPQYQILYSYEVLKDFEEEVDFTYYHTYEEARNEAIIYCLNLINK